MRAYIITLGKCDTFDLYLNNDIDIADYCITYHINQKAIKEVI